MGCYCWCGGEKVRTGEGWRGWADLIIAETRTTASHYYYPQKGYYLLIDFLHGMGVCVIPRRTEDSSLVRAGMREMLACVCRPSASISYEARSVANRFGPTGDGWVLVLPIMIESMSFWLFITHFPDDRPGTRWTQLERHRLDRGNAHVACCRGDRL